MSKFDQQGGKTQVDKMQEGRPRSRKAAVAAAPARSGLRSVATRVDSREKIEQIVEATLQLLREHDTRDVTVAMIAKKAGISRTSIYGHFTGVDEIFKYLADLYLGEIKPFVLNYVRKKEPRSLEEVAIYTVDAATEFFDAPHSIDKGLALRLQLSAPVIVYDYESQTVDLYQSLWKVSWPIAPESELHPFRILAIIQTGIFEASLRKYGRITEAYAEETKHVVVDYIQGVERRFRAMRKGADGISYAKRIEAALSLIGSGGQPQLLATCVEQLESLAKLSR